MRLKSILVVAIVCLLSLASFGQVQINSILTTNSTCANNGSITVNATSPVPPLFYSIIAGPVTAPLQTNNVFNSLPAGTYTIKVSDAVTNGVTQQAIIGGNYLQPDFNPITTNPYCTGDSNGQIIGNIVPGTGTGPYSWQLIAPSPVTTAPQSSDTFNNLPAGIYTIRLTDACGGFRTFVASLEDPPLTNISFFAIPKIIMTGCDTAFVVMQLHADVERFPLSVTYQTNAGTINVPDATIYDTLGNTNGRFTIIQMLPNFGYTQPLTITITDPCGVSIVSPTYYSQPFEFCLTLNPNFFNCAGHTSAYFDMNATDCMNSPYEMNTFINDPLIYEVVQTSSGNVVSADTLYGVVDSYGIPEISGLGVYGMPTNETYTITIHDACGRTFTQTYFLPDALFPPPEVYGRDLYPDGCADSTAFCFFRVKNFRSEPKLVFISGPPNMGSTKPGYEYSATYNYPDTIRTSGTGALTYRFDITDLAVGTYQVKVFDTCGFEMYDSVVVRPINVTNFGHQAWYERGCLGQNKLYFSVQAAAGHMKIRNISTGFEFNNDYWTTDFVTPLRDSLINLPAGTYVLDFDYWRYHFSFTPKSHSPMNCQSFTDTIVIEGYQTPAVFTSNYIQCQSGVHVEVVPDSSKGVPPYQYEIISGPQTFPVQASNVFDLISAGTYTVRVYDVCGNGSTSQITVDVNVFPPPAIVPFNCNSTSLSYGSSQYYSYQWTAPDGTVYTGDTLTIDPVTPADTGIYIIMKIVNINGCTDTFFTTHHVPLYNTTMLTASICSGNSVTVGSHTYNTTGVYTDTLVNISNCDSVVVLNLTIIPLATHLINETICAGESYTVGVHTYNQTGIYHDTLSTATCDSIVTLNLTVNPLITHSISQSICAGESYTVGVHTYTQPGIYNDTLSTAGCDSIVTLNLTVNPLITHSISQTICEGQSYTVGVHAYDQTGIYHDTLSTAGCDSIVTLNLTVNPLLTHSITQTICANESYTVGVHTYNQTGIYHDTLSTTGCDSIVTLNLTVDPLLTHSITQTICAGESYTVGIHTYDQTGIYHDTLSTAGCDSVVTLDLTVNPLLTHLITQTICANESYTVGVHTYNQTGIYHDTLSTAGCDSVVTLDLTVNPLLTHSITQTICANESYTVGVHTYNQTGIYHDTLSTAGCDSVVTLNLTVNPLLTHSIAQTICANESYTVGVHAYNQTGVYHDTLSTAGCDSVVTLNLTVNPLITHSINQSICAGESYTVGIHTYTQTGVYHDTLSTAACDSVVTLNLTVKPLATHLISDSICGGQVYVFNGHTYTQAGSYSDTLHTTGCDSVVTLNLSVLPVTSVQITASAYTVLPGDVIQLNSTASPSYLWTSTAGASIINADIQNPSAVINNSSWIYLNRDAGLCTSGDSLYVVVNKDSTVCSGAYIYVPSAFTPNRDGLNDKFRILSNKIRLNAFRVFNRWGEKVFETNDINEGWDGTYNGKLVMGSYVYMVSYYIACDPKARIMKGNIVLIH
ncbi:MAG: gliding motility-associated C-terminal domain-containing protein [Ferruginibacter sp.]